MRQTDHHPVLHEDAEDLLDDLTARYTVERREDKEAFGHQPLRTVRLIPRTPAAAPLAVGFTEVAGLVLRLGRWYRISLPVGTCAEDHAESARELRAQVSALVEGGLWERVHRRLTTSWSQSRLIGPDFRAGQEVPLGAAEARAARRDGFAAPVQWAPWPRRCQGV